MKSEGVKDVFKWLETECKQQKKKVDNAEKAYLKSKEEWGMYEDTQCLVDSAERNLERAIERLNTLVDVKISVEKYMKKLRHQGE